MEKLVKGGKRVVEGTHGPARQEKEKEEFRADGPVRENFKNKKEVQGRRGGNGTEEGDLLDLPRT